MNKEKPLIIVLSRNYSTGLGIIRSLGAAGYTVDLVASVKKTGSSVIASCSKYVRRSVEVLSQKIQGDEGLELIEELLSYVGKEPGDMMIFPTDDFTASVVDRNRNVLREHFLIPDVVGDGACITELMDKTVQADYAKKAGLNTPLEWRISLKGEIGFPEEVVFPCFVKPLQSISGHKTEMAMCCEPEELYTHLQRMKDFFSDREVLVQEFLDIDCEYSMSGVCMDQEVLIPAIIEKTRTAGYERGVAVSGKMVDINLLGSCKDKLFSLMKSFHYVGMFDMDLIVCDGKVYFSEVNLRSGGSNFAYFLNGVNLPEILVSFVEGQPLEGEKARIETYGQSFVYEKVAWEDYIHGYMNMRELRKCLSGAERTLLHYEADPDPGKCFERRIRLSALKHKVMKAIKKKKNE